MQKGSENSLAAVRRHFDPHATAVVKEGKHRYLMPLDDAMRQQIATLARPYPVKVESTPHAREA